MGTVMTGDGIKWSKDYEIGVPAIDNAHEELFRISRRLFLLSHDPAKRKWVAEEGIKYLKIYLVRHCSDEEEYMRSIKYPHWANHFEQHALMRDKIVPRMESTLRHNKFSEESVDQFLHILRLWLSRHILVHDVAIRKGSLV